MVVADVRVSDGLEGLFVTPREHRQGIDVFVALRGASPGLAEVRRRGSGVFVPPNAIEFLDRVEDVDLRWTPEALRYVENRVLARAAYPNLLEGLARLKDGGPDVAARDIADSEGLNVLDRHQVLNVAAMTMPDGFGLCIFDEQGAGKTVTLIYAFDLLARRDEADRVLVIAPKSMVPEWPNDVERFRPGMYRTAVVAGPERQKREALQQGCEVLVTNFETAISLEEELTALLRSRPGRTVLAVDESFFIKSPDAARTRAIRRLREWCGRAYVLCGTPAPNSPQDLVQQFSLVDFGLAFEGVDLPKDRTEAAPVVQDVVDRRGLFVRSLKADVLPDLPAKTFQRVFVPMAGRQATIYDETLKNLITDVEATSDAEFRKQAMNFLARRSALLQICSNPRAVDSSYDETPAKLVAIDSLLERLVERQREKVVVWSFYTASIDAMMDRYRRYGVMRYDGKVSDVDERREAVRRFQQDDASRVLIANPAAAGAGLTLHRARVAIYESLSNQAAHYLQSLDRIHRRGQKSEVEYFVLLCDKTVEVAEYERLMVKEAAAQSLLGDVVTPPLTRESFLQDARAAADLLKPGSSLGDQAA